MIPPGSARAAEPEILSVELVEDVREHASGWLTGHCSCTRARLVERLAASHERLRAEVADAREDTRRLERQNGDWEAVASLAVTKHKNAEAETARLRAVRPGIEKLLAECGFSTPGLLRILDPIFGEGPADYGKENAPKKHPDCVALMCGKIDCRRPGPCYIAARSPSTPDTPEH